MVFKKSVLVIAATELGTSLLSLLISKAPVPSFVRKSIQEIEACVEKSR